MIEMVYNGKESKGQSEVRLPKNIRQIGDNNSKKKIYVEDYVMSNLKKEPENEDNIRYGVLLGETKKVKGYSYIFVKGMAEVNDVIENSIIFNDEIWTNIYKDIKRYFDEFDIVGWFISVPYRVKDDMSGIKKIHLDNFAGTMKTFYLIDTVEKEENFYLYENGELKKQKGYVCFYERNYEMQEYMLERRERKSSEDGPDKVMKSIRNIIREKEELHEQKKNARFMYGVSTFMVIVILVIGINLMNNYQKMKKFDKSISSLIVQMSGNDTATQEEVVPVNKLEGGVYPTEAETTSQTAVTSVVSTENVTVTAAQPVEEQTVAATANEVKTYTVKAGDTIMGICKKYYGDTSKCNEVITYNNIKDENFLYIGQQIKLP